MKMCEKRNKWWTTIDFHYKTKYMLAMEQVRKRLKESKWNVMIEKYQEEHGFPKMISVYCIQHNTQATIEIRYLPENEELFDFIDKLLDEELVW
jgi:hypothetical protein